MLDPKNGPLSNCFSMDGGEKREDRHQEWEGSQRNYGMGRNISNIGDLEEGTIFRRYSYFYFIYFVVLRPHVAQAGL